MPEQTLIKLLKISIIIGLALLALGIYLYKFSHYMESLGVTGIIISAVCIAFGLIFHCRLKCASPFFWLNAKPTYKQMKKKINSLYKKKSHSLYRKSLSKINNSKINRSYSLISAIYPAYSLNIV